MFGTNKETTELPSSEIRPITGNVRKIRLKGGVSVVVLQGAEPKMEVFSNNASNLSKVLTTVTGDCLVVENEPTILINNGDGLIQIVRGNGNMVSGGNVVVRGSCNVVSGGDIVNQGTSSLTLRVELTLPGVNSLQVSGAGDLIYHGIDQEELSLDVSGAGAIEVAGKVNRIEADVSGAGDIAARHLFAAHARLRVSGAGNIKTTVAESVVARVSGVGKIKIRGNPPQRDTDVSGIGKIKFVDG